MNNNKEKILSLFRETASSVMGGVWMDVGAGWIGVDDTIPARKTDPILPDMRIDIIED